MTVTIVNMLEAKTGLSKLVQAIERGEESEIILARNGKPAARLVPLLSISQTGSRLGIAKGRFEVPDDFDADDEEIAQLFLERGDV